jgi:PAS domain-containing protein
MTPRAEARRLACDIVPPPSGGTTRAGWSSPGGPEVGVRVICSYCGLVLRATGGGAGISHGMCTECGAYFARLWAGMALGDYLELLPKPVLVVDGDGRVLAANRLAGEALGRDPAELRGLLGGEAMACARSRLPGGCGGTIHCRECTIRRAVTEVAQTGVAVRRRPAWLLTEQGRVELVVSARPVKTAVEVTLESMAPPAAA